MKRILVVDDDIDILEVLQIAFEAKGYEVFILSDGKEISENIKQFSPGIILLDVFLGDTNGVTICNQLKSHADTKHIPVILFSSHLNMETILKTCAADAFIGKPFNLNHLIELVERELSKVR
ncbi:MAG TPA: response regulator [Chitinophagaceae bacterium]|nr:response regulator [Chitinophagaceae bacterium]